MNRLMTIFGVILFASSIMISCGDGQSNIDKANQDKINTDSTLSTEKGNADSNTNPEKNEESTESLKVKVTSFVNNFYSSLELSPELNQKQYETGEVKFNKSKFNSCIDKNSNYSKERISNLTGDYHDRYNIRLLNINSVNITGNEAEVMTEVEYSINETGTFNNEEKIYITIDPEKYSIKKWEDLRVKKMEVAEYEGLENFKEKDFYKMLGSINK